MGINRNRGNIMKFAFMNKRNYIISSDSFVLIVEGKSATTAYKISKRQARELVFDILGEIK